MGRDTLEQLSLFSEEEKTNYSSDVETQVCDDCKKELPLRSYRIKNNHTEITGVLSNVCGACDDTRRQKSKLRRSLLDDPDKDYKCPICFRTEKDLKSKGLVVDVKTYKIAVNKYARKSVWRLDHCHITEKVRGFLCNPCNTALGNFKDSIDVLKRAIQFMERSDDNSTDI